MHAVNRSPATFPTLLVIALVATQLSQAAYAVEKLFDKKFTVSPGGTLDVDTETGTIFVSGVDAHEVTVRVTVDGQQSQIDDFGISADTDSHGVSVRGKRHGDWWLDLSWVFGRGLRVKYEIQVPRNYHLELRTAGGGIETQNIDGNVRGQTSGGQLRLNSITGSVEARTSGGSIQGQQITGKTLLRTSGGSITVTDVQGELDARTSGGSVRLQNIDGRLTARTSGGSIDASLNGVNRGVELRTSGGGIRVAVPKDFKATVEAHTSGGSVHCDLPVADRGDRDGSRNELYGDLNGGGAMLLAHTSGGGIRIRARE